jgi:IS5 family transposase
LDARWTKKHGKSYLGYKSRISIDVEYGFIRRHAVSDAAVHESQMLSHLLDDDSETNGLWADSAYRPETIEVVLAMLQFENHIHERAYCNHPLSEQQQAQKAHAVKNNVIAERRGKVKYLSGTYEGKKHDKAIQTKRAIS